MHPPCFDAGAIRSWPLNDPLFYLLSEPIFAKPCFTAAKRASERLMSGSTAGFWGLPPSSAEQGQGRQHRGTKSQGISLRPDLGKIVFCPSVLRKNAVQTGPNSDLVLHS